MRRRFFSSLWPLLEPGLTSIRVGTWRSMSKCVWSRQPLCESPFLSFMKAASAMDLSVLTTLPSTAVSTCARWPLADVADRLHLGGEGLDDAAEPLGIEDLDGLGQRPQRGPGAAELALHVLQRAGLLQGPQGTDDRVEEEEQDEQAVLIVMQAAVAGLVTLAADLVQLIEQRQEPFEVL